MVSGARQRADGALLYLDAHAQDCPTCDQGIEVKAGAPAPRGLHDLPSRPDCPLSFEQGAG
jgi:hypothetical protein